MNQSLDYPLQREQIISLLKEHGISPTRQRVDIASTLFQCAQHLSAEEIYTGVNKESQNVSRATVYNSLGLFSKKGLVKEVLIDRERVFYDSNNTAHNHMYNIDTGELHDLETEINITNPATVLPDNVTMVDTDIIIRVRNSD